MPADFATDLLRAGSHGEPAGRRAANTLPW
jgi:hypothetical protein